MNLKQIGDTGAIVANYSVRDLKEAVELIHRTEYPNEVDDVWFTQDNIARWLRVASNYNGRHFYWELSGT